MDKGERSLNRLEKQWLEDYKDQDGISISPDDIAAFINALSSFDEIDVNDEPRFSYEELHDYVNDGGELKEEQTKAVSELGYWASQADSYGEVDPRMFSWGYNLYNHIILHSEKLYVLPFYSFEEIISTSFTSPTVEESVEGLASEAEMRVPLLWGIADDLLDGLVQVHNDCGYIEDDPDQEFENGEIRAERLRVMRAGIGLAYRHCWQFVQGYAK